MRWPLWWVEVREARETADSPEPEVWLTDGGESFRMVSKFIGDLLASYLNQYAEPRRQPIQRGASAQDGDA